MSDDSNRSVVKQQTAASLLNQCQSKGGKRQSAKKICNLPPDEVALRWGMHSAWVESKVQQLLEEKAGVACIQPLQPENFRVEKTALARVIMHQLNISEVSNDQGVNAPISLAFRVGWIDGVI